MFSVFTGTNLNGMNFFRKSYQVKPNEAGFLYRNNVFEQQLGPGRYAIWDWQNRTELITIPTTATFIQVTNQEVLTKDNAALRFSFYVRYHIVNGADFLSHFAYNPNSRQTIGLAEQRLATLVQAVIRRRIVAYNSEELNEKRGELTEFMNDDSLKQTSTFGVSVDECQLIDITFPKHIQELFARHLEAKIRAKADLENARTTVATARALKNASELMKDDDNIKFFQLLETMTKIAAKGKHTFSFGDMQQLTRKPTQ